MIWFLDTRNVSNAIEENALRFPPTVKRIQICIAFPFETNVFRPPTLQQGFLPASLW